MIEDDPEKQTRFISQEEKDYILQSLGQNENNGEHKEVYEILRKSYLIDFYTAYLISSFIISFRNQLFHGARCYDPNHLWQS